MTSKYLIVQFRASNMVANVNLEAVDEDLSLHIPEIGQNSINWIIGHILVSRINLIKRFEQDYEVVGFNIDTYKRGSERDKNTQFNSLKELKLIQKSTLDKIVEVLSEISDDEFEKSNDNGRSLAEELFFTSFHESYHVGQIGLLRNAVGLKGAIK
jgi:uncharacterized damage-inducible protein DinB